MRILIVSPFPLAPPLHGGRVRTLGIARGLARAGAEVTLFCPWVPPEPTVLRIEPRLERRSHALVANLLPALLPFSIAPALALLSLQPITRLGVRRHLAAFAEADVWQFDFCAAASWMKLAPPEVTLVHSAHNVERDFFAPWVGSFRLGRWALDRIEALEREAVRRSALVVACSETDRRRLAELYGSPDESVVLPNGFDPDRLAIDRTAVRQAARAALGFRRTDRVILFLGGDAAHNRDACAFLERRVLPRLGEDDRLLVVGRCASGAAAEPRIRRLGFVEDLGPAFAAADVAVNPVAFGSGTNVKLAECLAAGLPVITTRFGLRGFPLPDQPGIVVAERDDLASVLASGRFPTLVAERERLAELSWDRLGADLLEVYRRIRRGGRPRVSAVAGAPGTLAEPSSASLA